MKMKRKKGATHVEMIISFVIFLSFLIFILVAFSPLKIFSKSSTNLDITKEIILESVSVNLSTFSLKINSTTYSDITEGCVNADFDSSLVQGKWIMKEQGGEIVSATIENDNLYFDKSGMFYKLHSSEELQERAAGTSGCYNLDKENYTLGVERTYNKISLIKLNQFFIDYNSDYEQIRDNLSLRNDFNVFILNSSGVVEHFKAEVNKPEGVEVQAVNIPIEILDENLTLNPYIMNIQVW